MGATANHDDLLAELAVNAGQPWAIQAERGAALSTIVSDLTLGKDVAPARLRTALAITDRGSRDVKLMSAERGKRVAIVPVQGLCLFGLQFPPFATSMSWLRVTIRQLAIDPKIAAIILDVNSPGGVINGVPEASAAIFAARGRKPVFAAVNWLAASAAYWLAASAKEIVTIPSGMAGSIGVFMVHADLSRALDMAGVKPTYIFAGEKKVDANPFEPLSDSARADLQADVNRVHSQFVTSVARGRGVNVTTVRETFGQGRTMMAGDALRFGLVDRIGAAESVLAKPSHIGSAARPGAGIDIAQRRVALPPPKTLGAVLAEALKNG